ncbi:LysR family transcriptional regulator [Paenibacillus sp. CN-4]|uniref:LysR family transcriptional regulator n=1 Tax=Paenibacillus nanchangensis TaxID=3348343 RepID=UPI00397A3C29
MNLHALRLFHTVASTGSVTRASELLNISQPAITSQIKKFESELSLTLLRPQGRGIALTSAGENVAMLAKRLFGVEQQIEQYASDYASGYKGYVPVAATYLPSHYLLPAWIAKFKQQYEQVEMNILTTNSSDALNKLLQGEADIAIYGGMPEDHPDTLTTEHLFRDELWFVVAPGHRYANCTISLAEMMKEPFVMREEGSSTRARLLALCRTYNAPMPRISLQFNGLHEAIQAVIAGYGANFVSSLVVKEHVDRGALCRVHVTDVHLENTIAICTRKNETLSAAAQHFIETVRRNPHKGALDK